MSDQNPQQPGEPSEPVVMVKRSALVAALVKHPEDVPQLTVLIGWVGDSYDPAYTRIYFSLALDSYVDVRSKDIRHSVPSGSHETDPAVVWVSSHSHLRPHSAKASDFASGTIVNQHFHGAGEAHLPVWVRGGGVVVSRLIGISSACDPSSNCPPPPPPPR